ncbi:flagellar hook-associated protein FlgK [Bacillus smithii]|uniref:flagellar hook-associated protein FlgK n=1 Tax=Bacillus smithii TaxID=1479 RepID=UPI00065E9355|nr:flagellar hook-associated protein FlgK [Bacillus smithii]AKP45833.1 Flagellar hook-associated protein FlgK [Bacillus smithii]MED4883505.1 flagellar hook-associated protein FlgK [Bacillus smithii]MED4928364.1 flagellar hook-associated protein FlgK [Bacillus smithii]
MTSTFHGLEVAKRGMMAQQTALYTTSQNIANANTPGYSRQRVNFVQTEPYPAASMNRPQIPGQMGTGVEAGSIERVREQFLDVQYRNENNKLGYWDSRSTALSRLEDVFAEPSDTDGLSAVMNEFWQSLQDLSVNPENEGARSVVLQRAQGVVDTFHYLSNSISDIQGDLGNQISVGIKDVNSILKQIAELNQQIGEVEPNGYLPNDLYDERDRLVDQLSSYLNVKVEKMPSGGNALDIAEGQYKITLLDANGNPIATLVDGSQFNQLGFSTEDGKYTSVVSGPIKNIEVYTTPNDPSQTESDPVVGNEVASIDFYTSGNVNFSQGKLRGLMESYGYQTSTDADGNPIVAGIYPEMQDKLDQLAYTFGTLFNTVQKLGFDLEGNPASKDFFTNLSTIENAASNIQLNSDLQTKDIAASSNGLPGDGKNAINLGNIFSMDLSKDITLEGVKNSDGTPVILSVGKDPGDIDVPITTSTINSFYEGIIGGLGVASQQAQRLSNNSNSLVQSADERRQSVSSVSLDEEMTNLIKFQHAYNAAARNITVMDEMLDKVINGMGVVGR